MELIKKKFIIDSLMFVDFLMLIVSGFVLKFVYPAGEKSGRAGVRFLLDRFGWLKVHDIAVVVIILLLLVHLFLNWNWIKCSIKNIFVKGEERVC
jgi:hypothetical protein